MELTIEKHEQRSNKTLTHDEGWRAQLDLEISHRIDKSVVTRSRQNGPLTIQSPFYPEGDVCHLYLLHPPAGIVGGDKLRLSVNTINRGAALITTPGATKFYRTNGLVAEQYQVFTISDGTSLEWLPHETIYFPNAKARLATTIHLQGTASFLGWEIHCLGLPVCGKDFEDGQARMGFSLFRDNQPLLLESINISKEKKKYQAAFLQNQPVFGSFVATGGNEQLVNLLRQELLQVSSIVVWGVTLVEDLLVIRYLGPSTSQACHLFVKAWEIVRPHILGRKAILPRIWAT